MKKHQFMRMLSLMLAAILCLGVVAPAGASAPTGGTQLEFTQVDNRVVSARIAQNAFSQPEEEPSYLPTDLVRVSILLDGKSTLEAGYPTGDVAENAAAMSYRQGLARRQTGMAAAISTEALDGEPLDVVWNLTLAANLISANVPYGKMEAIRELSGVRM
ncbi:MAG: hypothetical protein ACLU9S_20585 [Oscillospiraceae bacterium]